MNRSLRRRAPVLLLVLCAPLILSSSQVGSDPLAEGRATLVSELAGGSTCEAGQPIGSTSVQSEIEAMAARGELPGAGAAASDVVMLNGRGYNYGPPPDRELDLIRLEFLRAEAKLGAASK